MIQVIDTNENKSNVSLILQVVVYYCVPSLSKKNQLGLNTLMTTTSTVVELQMRIFFWKYNYPITFVTR